MAPPIPNPDQISAWLVEIPLLHAFSSATAVLGSRRLIVVKVRSGDAAGWGEAAPVPGHSRQTVDEMWASLHRSVAALRYDPPPPNDGILGAAFAQANADLAARLADVPLWRHLGGKTPVWASAAIGLDAHDQPDSSQLESAAADGYRYAKLKITNRTRIEGLASVIADFPDVTFGVDANGSLDFDDTRMLGRLDDLGLSYIEQPGAAADLAAHRRLRTRMQTPISLDESAHSAAVIDLILAGGSADIINLKAGRFGTVETLRLAKKVTAAGRKARLGGLIESGIGRGHTVALAAHEAFAVVGDIAGSDRYFADDLVRPQWRVVDGQLVPSDAPGLGVDIDEATVARFAVESLTAS